MKYHYCSKCGNLVFPSKGLDRVFGTGQKFCSNCGESTETAIVHYCKNGHSMMSFHMYCKKCGATRDSKDESLKEEAEVEARIEAENNQDA